MNPGMLWLDSNEKIDINVKIERAVSYYQMSYGEQPNLCFVHPSILKKMNGGVINHGMEVKANKKISPKHIWVGVRSLAQ